MLPLQNGFTASKHCMSWCYQSKKSLQGTFTVNICLYIILMEGTYYTIIVLIKYRITRYINSTVSIWSHTSSTLKKTNSQIQSGRSYWWTSDFYHPKPRWWHLSPVWRFHPGWARFPRSRWVRTCRACSCGHPRTHAWCRSLDLDTVEVRCGGEGGSRCLPLHSIECVSCAFTNKIIVTYRDFDGGRGRGGVMTIAMATWFTRRIIIRTRLRIVPKFRFTEGSDLML